jgi:hypothetical protein
LGFTITTREEKEVIMADSTSSQVPPPGSFQPVPQPVGAPSPKSGSSAVKIILIILGIFVGLGIIVAGIVGYTVYRVAHSIHKDANGNITMTTPKGTITANSSDTLTAADLGIAIYPGATEGKDRLRMNIAGKSMVTAKFLTQDSPAQVMAFYEAQAGPNAQTNTTSTGGTISIQNGANSITVKVTQSANLSDGETQFTIVNISGS